MNKKAKYNEKSPPKEPILTLKELGKVRSVISKDPRDLLLFDIAIKTGLKLKDILNLRVKDLMGVPEGNKIPINVKNGNLSFIMNETIQTSFLKYVNSTEMVPDDFLFKLRNSRKPLSMAGASVIIKGWFRAANIKGNYGAVALRKTWEYSMRKKVEIDPTLKEFNPYKMDFFHPIEPKTTQEIVYNKLYDAIISGKIPPGTELTPARIAETFNVSLAPVRVALYWLEAKGLITARKKKASIVKKLSISDIKETIQIRLALESFALKSSINVCTEETLLLAESLLSQLDEKESAMEEFDRLNTKFHLTIYRDINMPLLLQFLSDLCERIRPYIVLIYTDKDVDYKTHPIFNNIHHRRIIESIRQKDYPEAIKNLERDLEKGIASLESILEKRTYLHPEINNWDISMLFD